MAAKVNMIRGDSKTFRCSVTDSVGAAVDLSSAFIWFSVKKRYNDSDEKIVLQKTTDDGIQITDAPAGEFEITIEPEDTAELEVQEYVYDVQVRLYDDAIITPSGIGVFNLKPDVTNEIDEVPEEPEP